MKKALSLIAIAALIFAGCKKEYLTNEVTNITAPKENDIIGFITLFDEFGTRLTDNAGMKITVENSTPVIEATTDANGKFI